MNLSNPRQKINSFAPRLPLLLFLIILPCFCLFSGAWVQKKQGYYFKVSAEYTTTRSEFDYQGEEQLLFEDLEIYQNSSYREIAARAYIEYGLSPFLTIVAKVPFKNAIDTRTIVDVGYFEGEQRNVTTGVGDLEIKTRIKLYQKAIVLAIQPGIKIPLGYNTANTVEGPRLGSGEVDYEGQLLLGSSIHPWPLYLSGGIGYRARGGALHDELFFSGEVGAVLSRFNLKGEISGVRNRTTPPDIYGATIHLPLPGGGGALPVRLFGDQHFLKIGGEILYKPSDKFGVSASLANIISGNNVIAGTTLSLGVVLTR